MYHEHEYEVERERGKEGPGMADRQMSREINRWMTRDANN